MEDRTRRIRSGEGRPYRLCGGGERDT